MSIRLSQELKSQFQEAARQSGLKQEDFIITLLNAYSEAQAQEGEAVAVSQEKRQIRAGMSQIQTLIEAVIDRASDQERQAVESVIQAKQEYAKKSEVLNSQINELKTEVKELETENARLKENEESRESLKQAFDEKQEAWETKRYDLESRIMELTEKLATISDENIGFRKDVDQLKEKLETTRKELEKVKSEHKLQLKDLELEYQNKVHDIQTELANQCDGKIGAFRQEYEDRIQAAIETERQIANSRVADLQEQLIQAKETILQLNRSHEEKLKAAIESERMAADKRVKEIIEVVASPGKKTGKVKSK
ncbi:MAG: hypothetical protein JRI28_05755 [Deltaproteobacteria bacterium]|nr:hypothetical protein [Deltaproteobacteria bacterium]